MISSAHERRLQFQLLGKGPAQAALDVQTGLINGLHECVLGEGGGDRHCHTGDTSITKTRKHVFNLTSSVASNFL